MIVLESMDPQHRTMELRRVEEVVAAGTDDMDAVQRLLDNLGVYGFSLDQHTATSGIACEMQHSWSIRDGCTEYEAVFNHAKDATVLVAAYSAVALSTYGVDAPSALMQLRLAIYELCHNVFDHGVPLGEDAKLTLGLRFESGEISGFIQDQCEHFDPFDVEMRDLEDHIKLRSRRGYGVYMVKRVLDEMTHEYNDQGNLLKFRKRMTP